MLTNGLREGAAATDGEAVAGERPTHATAFRSRLAISRWLEDVVVVGVAFFATLHAEWRIVSRSLTYQTDAQIHEFWMRRFQDSELFSDPLTDSLLDSGYSPPAFRALYWLASHVVDPVFFGELLPLVLQPLAVWLLFRIVRSHVAWRPAAWIGAGLFLVPWDVLRFSGGHPRAFAHPIVLLTVFLLLSRRNVAAALIPPLGLLLYPPAGLGALGIVVVASLDRRRPFLRRARAPWALVSVLGVGAAALLTRLTTGSQDVISEAEARLYPEFGPDGQMHFFVSSTLEYLSQNYSGFFLQISGSILAVAALLLIVIRPRNALLLRWEVWCMPIVALALFAAAHALLFRLYLPHRYTYPLLPFFCIAIAVFLRPTLEALAARSRVSLVAAPALGVVAALVALTVFPLGPRWPLASAGAWLVDAAPVLIAGLLVGLLLAAALWPRGPGVSSARVAAALVATAALAAGSVVVSTVAFADHGRSPGAVTCTENDLYRYLGTLPKDTIVAAEAGRSGCISIASRRAVVISRKLYQPWALDYFALIRERMFQTVRAFEGPSVAGVAALGERYGADYLVVGTAGRDNWGGMEPFTSEARRLRRAARIPAVDRLPERCVTWSGGTATVYSLACISSELSR